VSDLPPEPSFDDIDAENGAQNFQEEAGDEEKVHIEVTSSEVSSVVSAIIDRFRST
jgi:hypothetical protein